MDQRGTANPYFPASQSPEKNLRHLSSHPFRPERAPQSGSFGSSSSSSTYDDQTLALALSRLQLSSTHNHQQTSPFGPYVPDADMAPPTFGSAADPLMGRFYTNSMGGLRENHNVALMRAQKGVHNENMGFLGGPHMDYLVGPSPGRNLGGADVYGGGVDFRRPTHEAARLTYEMLNQRDYGYAPPHGFYNNDPFLQCTKVGAGKINTHYPISPHNGVYDGLIDSLVSRSLSFTRPNSYSSLQFSQEKLELLSIEDFRGRLVSLAKDQTGSKVLQMKIEEKSEEEIELVLFEVIDHVSDLIQNQFGSYFVHKLFAVCNENQRTRIIGALTKTSFQLVGVCLNEHGAKAMQKMLEKLNTPQQISLVMSAISPGAVALANDPNGQHVIRHCVVNFSYEFNKHLLSEIAENCFRIATDKSGCCVLPSCVENSHGEPKERLINEIKANAVQLAEDPYGNYVVQHLLGLRLQHVTLDLLRRFQGYFLSLSCNKYASNVVEKFLLESGEDNAETIIKELLLSKNAAMLLVDPYGNFVVQSALSVSKGKVQDALVQLIQDNVPSMRSNIYGKKILAWFDSRKKAAGCIKLKK